MKRDCSTSRISVSELVGLLDTMSPPERQAATTAMEPLRQQELNAMPEYIDPVALATGSSDIRSAPVQTNTVSRRTAHMPMSVRPPARPGNMIVPSEADVVAWGADYLLLFACLSWSVIATCTLFVLALL